MDKQVEQIHEELDNLLNSCGVHTEHIHKDFLYVVARHFAEWQNNQMKEALQTEYEKGRFDSMQDFLEKAEELLYEQFNIHPHDCHVVQYVSDTPLEDIDDFVEQFKNYMQDE